MRRIAQRTRQGRTIDTAQSYRSRSTPGCISTWRSVVRTCIPGNVLGNQARRPISNRWGGGWSAEARCPCCSGGAATPRVGASLWRFPKPPPRPPDEPTPPSLSPRVLLFQRFSCATCVARSCRPSVVSLGRVVTSEDVGWRRHRWRGGWLCFSPGWCHRSGESAPLARWPSGWPDSVPLHARHASSMWHAALRSGNSPFCLGLSRAKRAARQAAWV